MNLPRALGDPVPRELSGGARRVLLDHRAHSHSGIERYSVLALKGLTGLFDAGTEYDVLLFSDQQSAITPFLEDIPVRSVITVDKPPLPFADIRDLIAVEEYAHIHFWHPSCGRPIQQSFSATGYDDLRLRYPALNGTQVPISRVDDVLHEMRNRLGLTAPSCEAVDVTSPVGFYRVLTDFLARASSFMIACSRWAAETLAETTATPVRKWRVILPRPEAVRHHFALSCPRRPRQVDPAAGPFALHVGGVTAHHRPDIVWEMAADSTFRDQYLIIVGSDWGNTEPRSDSWIKRGRGVLRLDSVTDDELVWLYQNSRCLIVASLREGFCLPLLEAAVLGSPILHTDAPGTAEALTLAGPQAAVLDRAIIEAVRATESNARR